jgi:hypothetical protein
VPARRLIDACNTSLGLAWTPDGSRLITSGAKLSLWNPDTGTRERIIDQSRGAYAGVAFSPSGDRIALGDYTQPDDTFNVLILNASDWTVRHTLTGHTSIVHSLAWSPDGSLVAAGAYNGLVLVWESASGTLLHRFEGHTASVVTAAWSPGGQVLATAGLDKTIRLWDTREGKLVDILRGHRDRILNLHWSANGESLHSMGLGRTLREWNARWGRLERVRECPGPGSFAPDGRSVVTHNRDWDKVTRLWDVQTGLDSATLLLLDAENWQLPDPRHDYQVVFPTTRRGRWTLYAWTGTYVPSADAQPARPVYLVISPEGHYRGSPGVENKIVYVVQTPDGQETLSPEEFARRCGWRNDPSRVPGDPGEEESEPETLQGPEDAYHVINEALPAGHGPDMDWVALDSGGNEHRWRVMPFGQTNVTTLRWVVEGPATAEHGPRGRFVSQFTGDTIVPGTRPRA